MIAERYRQIISRMTDPRVTLVAVSKTQPLDAIEALYRLGHRDFGENYVQELIEKAREFHARGYNDIRWHFIGHLQTNKVKMLIPIVHAIHSVDSIKLGHELAKRWAAQNRPGRLPIFIEVNLGGETSKSGLPPEKVSAIASDLAELPELKVCGLMCIPPPGTTHSGAPFKQLRELELQCRPATHGALSMGMTDDFEIAIREGATHVRVGTALFGSR